MRASRIVVWLVFVVATAFAAAEDGPSSADLQYFEKNVRPLLAQRCFKCHGAEKHNADLRLDSLQFILTGGESGPAIAPGRPEKSLLIEAINYESLEMPPDGKLAEEQREILVRWVKMGAPWPTEPMPVATPSEREKITDAERAFWSFQPLRSVSVPSLDSGDWCQNDIDRFVLARLRKAELSPSREADRIALARRAYFDLIGLPPSPEEVAAFLEDGSPDAYEKMVDRLLDSPHYGERWARHWLDLVRYAESDGYKQDAFRPHAWRYRDYVIRSLNDDKPYDQFVAEQIAGDELAPGDPEALIATGYLRHWIYEYNQRDVRSQWDNILNDITDVTGDVFLGLGMGCARCHDHKFDPILQKDYYRLRAFFAPLVPRDDMPLAASEKLAEYRAQFAEWEAATADIRRQIDELERPIYAHVAQPAIDKFPPDIRPMMEKPAAERSPLEQQLAGLAFLQVKEEYEKVNIASRLNGESKARWDELKKQLAEFDHLRPAPLPAVFAATDVGPDAPPTFIPGDRRQEDIAPGFLSVLDPADAAIERPQNGGTTGRRTALARWLTDPQNPLTARVIVNRVWQYHFGRGLVATSSDFGHLGEPPSHPELLDWLARRFVEESWSLKGLHRLIMNSATYRQTSRPETSSLARQKDPDNRLLWRMTVRRLDAEQIRDAMLTVTGELDPAAGGASADWSSPRRTIYTKVIRNERDPLLDVFDAPDGFGSTSERNVTTTPTQSLLMINGDWTLKRANALAVRLTKMQPADDQTLVEQAYRLVYGRRPDAHELSMAESFMHAAGSEDSKNRAKSALVDFCHVLLNSNEFLYID